MDTGGDKVQHLRVNTGGLRNEEPLTPTQINECTEYAIKLGTPRDKIKYIEGYATAYGEEFDIVYLGTDVYPAQNAGIDTKSANSRISWKGAIAHEVIGHRETVLNGLALSDEILDEAQASIRAARFAPDLSAPERITLLRDAIYRLNKNGYKISEVRDLLNIKERQGG